MRVVFISDLNATRYTANMEKKMLGKNTGSMTFKETNNPIDSGKFGLPAMETSISGGGKLLGYDVMAQATFTAEMQPDGSWLGECPNTGVIFCSEGVAKYRCNGIGNMKADGGAEFRGGASFETTSEALSELNGKYFMFTYDSDAEGNAEWNLYPCL